jgi:glycosyltransferase involved in cell wall biosynthesis
VSPSVVYWNNIPAPYMVERFNALSRRGNIDFEAWFSARTKVGRSWQVDERSWEFRHRYVSGADRRWHSLVVPSELLWGRVPDLLVSLYAGPAFLIGSSIARRRGARTAFWVEPTGDLVTPRRRWKEWLKARVLPRADGILTTGPDGRAFSRRYTVREERTFVVPHVIDYPWFAERCAEGRAERAATRSRFRLEGVTFLYVGRLLRAKGLEYLIDAFARCTRATPTPMSLLLVGDGADDVQLRARCRDEQVENVVFAGFQRADTLPSLYSAADVFVFPTLGDTFGMAISEAMACGLPVVATSVSGELDARVTDGVNGFVVPPADTDALVEALSTLAADPELRVSMGQKSRERAAGQSPDVWARAFEIAVASILDASSAHDSPTPRNAS